MNNPQTQPKIYNYVALVSNPTLPSLSDGVIDFITRSKEELQQKVIVPLFVEHEIDKPAIGTCELVFIPMFTTKESREICLVIGNIKSTIELPNGTPISASYPLLYKKSHVNFADEILEVSVVGKAHVPYCQIYQGDELVVKVKQMMSDPTLISLFKTVLKSIGEIDEKR